MMAEGSISFVCARPSKDAIRLANALYQTALFSDSMSFTVSLKRLYALFDLTAGAEALRYLYELFEELREPVKLQDFSFEGEHYAWLSVCLCTLEAPLALESQCVVVHLDARYLEALRRFDKAPYIIF